jgi:WD40 repeat protein
LISLLQQRTYALPCFEALRHDDAIENAQFNAGGTRIATASRDGTARVWDALTGMPLGQPLRHAGWVRNAAFTPNGLQLVTASQSPLPSQVLDRLLSQLAPSLMSIDSGGSVSDPVISNAIARAAQALGGQSKALMADKGSYEDFARFAAWEIVVSGESSVQIWDPASAQPLMPAISYQRRTARAVCSPDGKRVLTSTIQKEAHVWDAQTGRLLLTLPHDDPVADAQFSPDGTRIVTATGTLLVPRGAIRVWDASTGKPLTASLKHDACVFNVCFSSDGRRVVSSSQDKSARIWDVAEGKLWVRALGHDGPVLWACFSPDGTKVATASADGTARLWDALSGDPITPSLKHGGAVRDIEFSPDGRSVVTASLDGTVRLWDSRTGQTRSEPVFLNNAVASAAFSADGQRLLTTVQGEALGECKGCNEVTVWDVRTGEAGAGPLALFGVNMQEYRWGSKGGELMMFPAAARFDPSGRYLVATTFPDHGVFDVGNGKALVGLKSAGDGFPWFLEFSPKGNFIFGASNEKEILRWDASTGEELSASIKAADNVASVRFTPDEQYVLVAAGSEARLWDNRTGQPKGKPMSHNDLTTSARISPDGRRIVTASADHTVRIWDALTGEPLGEPLPHDNVVLCVEFSPDGQRVASGLGNQMQLTFLRSLGVWAPVGDTGQGNFSAQVWDVGQGPRVAKPMPHRGVVFTVQFSPDGRKLVTASADRTARVWDAESGEPLSPPLGHQDIVTSAEFSPDGHRVVTASRDGTARIWDAETGVPLSDPLPHGGPVNSVQFSPDGQHLATAARNGSVRVWDTLWPASRVSGLLCELAEAVSGQRLNDQGAISPLPITRFRALEVVRAKIHQQPVSEDMESCFIRWFLADRSARAISPLSGITVPAYVQYQLSEGQDEDDFCMRGGLDQAARFSATNGLIMARLSAYALVALGHETNNPRWLAEADFFSRRAVEWSPSAPSAWAARANFCEKADDVAEAARLRQDAAYKSDIWQSYLRLQPATNWVEAACQAQTRAVDLARSDGETSRAPLVGALRRRAELLKKLNRLSEAEADEKRAEALVPSKAGSSQR